MISWLRWMLGIGWKLSHVWINADGKIEERYFRDFWTGQTRCVRRRTLFHDCCERGQYLTSRELMRRLNETPEDWN